MNSRTHRILLLAILTASPAIADPIMNYAETNLGGGFYDVAFRVVNTFDPAANAGVNLYDIVFNFPSSAFLLSLPSGWTLNPSTSGTNVEAYSTFPGPPSSGTDIAPGQPLGGFEFLFERTIGDIAFAHSFTDPTHPDQPLILNGTSSIPSTSQTIAFGTLGKRKSRHLAIYRQRDGEFRLSVSFASTTPSVCTVSGNTVTVIASGGCSITASQAGTAIYLPATPVTQKFTVLFSDVSPSDIFYNQINAFAQYGITAGCGNNNFCPTANVTRDEMAIFIVRSIYGSDNFTYATTPYFTDVTPSTFAFQWIQKLKDLGITAGCTATTYCPSEVVTRDQMAIFVIRARLGVIPGPTPTFTYPSTPYFTDATVDDEFAFPWIQRMKLENITSGCTATTYCSTDPVTREEMATFIMRGAFNQFLPAGTPILTQINPSTLPVGTSGTYTITGNNTNFVQGTTQLSPIPGVTIGAITVSSPTSMTVQLTASANAVAQPYSILAITGTEQDVLPNGLIVQ